MTTRKPTAKAVEAAMETTEVPATRPVLIDSEVLRLDLSRKLANTGDEIEFVNVQIESAARVCDFAKTEAQSVFHAEYEAATKRKERAEADAERIMKSTIDDLTRRRADLAKAAAGLQHALDVTAEETPVLGNGG